MTEAVTIEKEFICDALPVDLIGMNGRLMSQVRAVGQAQQQGTGRRGMATMSASWLPH